MAMAALIPPTTGGLPAIPTIPAVPAGPPSWHEVYMSANRLYNEPDEDFGVLFAALFATTNAPDFILSKVKAQTCLAHSPIISLISNEDPPARAEDHAPQESTPCHWKPCESKSLDGLVYGFTGAGAMNLVAFQIPASTLFKTSMAYNDVLDDAMAIQVGLDTPYLPTKPSMPTSVLEQLTCKCMTIILSISWYMDLAGYLPL